MHEQWETWIAEWRRALADKIGNDSNILDELECHLRDEMDRQSKAGQTPELAFRSAIAKIGAPDALAPEFAKLAAPWWPIRAVAAGVLLVIVAALILLGVRMRGRADGWLIVHVMSITVGYLLTYGIGVLALCYAGRRMMRELALGQQTSLVRALVLMGWLGCGFTVIGTVTGCVWAHDHLGRFWDFWDLRESGVLIVLGWQAILLGSAMRSQRSLRWLMCWGVLGNLAVTYAWFVAAFLSSAHPYESMGTMIIFVLVPVTAILTAIGATALLSSGWLRRLVVTGN